MSYEFNVSLHIKDFKRILSWGNKDKKFTEVDDKLATKLQFILENLIEEERILNEGAEEDG